MPLGRRVFKHLCRYQYLWHCRYYFNMCICRLTSFIYLVWKKWGMLIASIVWIQALTMSKLYHLHKTACPPWSLPFCTHACYLKTSAGTRSTPSFAVLIKTKGLQRNRNAYIVDWWLNKFAGTSLKIQYILQSWELRILPVLLWKCMSYLNACLI